MRYWTFAEPTDLNDMTPSYVTLSDDEIITGYWYFWYDKMCAKFGKEVVDRDYSKLDCINDWVAVNWAWLSDVNGDLK